MCIKLVVHVYNRAFDVPTRFTRDSLHIKIIKCLQQNLHHCEAPGKESLPNLLSEQRLFYQVVWARLQPVLLLKTGLVSVGVHDSNYLGFSNPMSLMTIL